MPPHLALLSRSRKRRYWSRLRIREYAKERRAVPQADFFVNKYGSKDPGILVSLVAVMAMIPYL